MPLSEEVARELAYYKSAQGVGVLAPRAWHCFGIYGSSTSTLFVSPQPLSTASLFSAGRNDLSGPVVVIRHVHGDTSGRFAVAEVIARVFPSHRKFLAELIEGFDVPPGSLPSRPYPNDRLTYKSESAVEYRTPAQAEGLGTHSGLKKDNSPIDGVAILVGRSPDLLLLSVRLPSDLRNLTAPIVQQLEDEAENRYGERR